MKMNNRIFAITKYSIIEAMSDRFIYLIAIGFLIILLVSAFVSELAITETSQTQVAIQSYLLRLFCVFTLSLFVITSMIREFNDKGFELILSQPITRSDYFTGKWFGYILIAFFMSAVSFLCVALHASINDSLIWSLSLFAELIIFLTFSMFCLFTLNSITLSFSVLVAFYILCRAIDVIRLISDSPILESASLSHHFINLTIDVIAYLVPSLNRFTQTDWLVYGSATSTELLFIFGQMLIYTLLLASAALFDLYRKEL